MKSPVLLLVFLLLSGFGLVQAQYNSSFLNYSHTGRSISLNSDFEAGSNGMSSGLINKLIFGGHISDELKIKSSEQLRSVNNFGINLNSDLSAFIKGGKKFDFLIGFKTQELLNATYSRDFFNLMFYGNDMFRGKTANLSNCNVNALSFQEIKFGAIIHHVDSLAKIGVSVSVLRGRQLFYIKTGDNSSLYTSADGSESIFTSNFSMALSDTNNKELTSFNGIGASTDIYFETPYKSKVGKRSVLTVNANNIGFIYWLNQSVQYSADTSLRYAGYHASNLFEIRDSTIQRINRDSLLRQLTEARHESFNVNIPTNLLIINKIYFGARELFALSTGFRYMFNANYKPYIFIEPQYRVKNVVFTLHVSYGGYVRLNVGTAITWNTQGFFLRLGSNSLQGFVVPKTGYGQSIFFSLAKKLK
ncbi:MAG: hypothetical protein KF900_07005 [Bacteroidetes bacterium]|nr:hypothetical protein [Bacteroidota bacterium]